MKPVNVTCAQMADVTKRKSMTHKKRKVKSNVFPGTPYEATLTYPLERFLYRRLSPS